MFLGVIIFIEESCDSARSQVYHVADVSAGVCGEVGQGNQHFRSTVAMSDDLYFVAST